MIILLQDTTVVVDFKWVIGIVTALAAAIIVMFRIILSLSKANGKMAEKSAESSNKTTEKVTEALTNNTSALNHLHETITRAFTKKNKL